MRVILRTVVLLLVSNVFMTVGMAQANSKCDADRASSEQVRAVAHGIITADNDRDLLRVLSYYAVDAILLPPNEPAVVGHDAIRPRYQNLFANYKPEIQGKVAEVCVRSDLAYVRGHNGGRLVSIGTGEARNLDDIYLMLLRRNDKGIWQISHVIWHRQSF